MHDRKGVMLVTIQFVCLGLLFYLNSFTPKTPFSSVLFVGGMFIGLSALSEMRNSKFSVFPQVRKGAEIVDTGIYKYVRHPMYLSVLMIAFSSTLNNLRLVPVLLFFTLVADLYYKIEHEEKSLIKNVKEYRQYMKNTSKLIPKIY